MEWTTRTGGNGYRARRRLPRSQLNRLPRRANHLCHTRFTDSFTVQHWVSVRDGAGGLTWTSLEAPVVELGALAPSSVSQAHHAAAPPGFGRPWLRDEAGLESGHLYSFVMDNNFRTNFQASQVGDMLFRYALTTHGPDWTDADSAEFGWGVSTPLEPVCIRGPQAGILEPGASFCRIEGAKTLLLALKAAEDGDGLVIRLAETKGERATATLVLPRTAVARATAASVAEEDREELVHGEHTVEVPLRPRGCATVRVRDGHRYAGTDRLTWLS
jgi:alpha-mannosidase